MAERRRLAGSRRRGSTAIERRRLEPDPEGRKSRSRSCANHTTGSPWSYRANTPLPRPPTNPWTTGQRSPCRVARAVASSAAASGTYCGPWSATKRSPSQKSENRGLRMQGYPTAAAAAWHSASDAGTRVGGIRTPQAPASSRVRALSKADNSMSVGPHPTATPTCSHSARSAAHSTQERSRCGSTTSTACSCAQCRSAANAATSSPL